MAAILRLDESTDRPIPVLELPDRTEAGGRERRALPRTRASFHVRISGERTWLSGIDLSFGGLMCRCEEPVWPGNVVDLEVLLPDEAHPVPARARVVELVSQRGELAMRLRFEMLNRAHRTRLAMWVSRAA